MLVLVKVKIVGINSSVIAQLSQKALKRSLLLSVYCFTVLPKDIVEIRVMEI